MKTILYYPRTGRGHKSQRALADQFIKRNKATVIASFHETGPGLIELRKAMAASKEAGVILVITRFLGTLGLNFMQAKAECEVDFIAINQRKFNRNTLPVFTARARDDWHRKREAIKDAMAEKKKDGAVFGTARRGHWNKTNRHLMLAATVKAAEASVRARRKLADDAYAPLMPKMLEMRERGAGPTEIADALNLAGHLTTKGMPFTAPTVFKILKRHGGRNGQARTQVVGREIDLATA